MTQDGRGQPVVVPVGACSCPGGAHTTDTVTLRAEPTIPMGVAAWIVVADGGTVETLTGQLAEVWLNFGIIDWTFTNADGKPVPVTPANIARLIPFEAGLDLADRADKLYSDTVLAPLVARRSRLLQLMQTAPSTPASQDSGDTPPTPSSPSPRAARVGKPSEVPAL